MILKYFDFKKINLETQKFILLYGNNQGHKEQFVNENLKPILPKNIYSYEEAEVLKNIDDFPFPNWDLSELEDFSNI